MTLLKLENENRGECMTMSQASVKLAAKGERFNLRSLMLKRLFVASFILYLSKLYFS